MTPVDDPRVAVIEGPAAYPAAPFAPPHSVQDRVGRALTLLGAGDARALDPRLVGRGGRVCLKPNWVRHYHPLGLGIESMITHGSIIRSLAEAARGACGREGNVTIGDAPIQNTDFAALLRAGGIDRVREELEPSGGIVVADFRAERALMGMHGLYMKRQRLTGDPEGYFAVDLGSESLHQGSEEDWRRLRVTNYDPDEMPLHHNAERHEYLVAGSVLKSDLVVGLPKLKTHRKVGITVCLKNLVGINGNKDWLPHHRRGSRAEGGDEYLHPSLLKRVYADLTEHSDVAHSRAGKVALFWMARGVNQINKVIAPDAFSEGSWWGNDTLWRTVLDLNRILLYGGRDGKMRDAPQRQLLYVVDGIVAGEGEGPVEPTPKPCGLLLAGYNPAAIDTVAASIMGLDYRKIPVVAHAYDEFRHPLARFSPASIRVLSDSPAWNGFDPLTPARTLEFLPPQGWRGHIELDRRS